MRELCDSAKKGHVCPDSLCRGADVTLCGFDKELYEDITRDYNDCDPEEFDDQDD